ncbi:MAG: LysR family transcriptional regulator [Chloroflexi bacterium]|nr:MAG: LysR family transcriptional regulator [Chloroflexota bacterium]
MPRTRTSSTRSTPLALERDITLHQLRVFKAVADRLSFSVAAHDLKLSQPSVSYQVKELERAIGMDLLDRLGKHVELTQAGHLLYGYVRRILNLIDESSIALEEMHGLERGTLKVGASTTVGIYVIPVALGAFKRLHPGLVISLEIGNRGKVQEDVLKNDLDLAIVGPTLKNPDLQVIPFLSDELVVIAPRGHPLADRQSLTLKDLKDEPFIMREEGSGTRWSVEKAARRVGVNLAVAMELGSNGAIKHAVESGLGLAAISRYAITLEQAGGRLVVLEVDGFPVRRQWNIVHLKRSRLAKPVAGFIDFLTSGNWAEVRPPSD